MTKESGWFSPESAAFLLRFKKEGLSYTEEGEQAEKDFPLLMQAIIQEALDADILQKEHSEQIAVNNVEKLWLK